MSCILEVLLYKWCICTIDFRLVRDHLHYWCMNSIHEIGVLESCQFFLEFCNDEGSVCHDFLETFVQLITLEQVSAF